MTVKPEKILYTAHATSTGGREGTSKSDDGVLDLKLTTPKGLGGNGAVGTNPEQLFAAAWSACFEGAIGLAARQMKIALPADLAIDAEVDLSLADGTHFLRARLNVRLPGLDRDLAQALVDAAHEACPYSKAVRGNVDVTITLV